MDRTFRGGPSDDFKLSVLTKRHRKYLSIKGQFLSKFQKPVDGLRVERIFKIQVREWTARGAAAARGCGCRRPLSSLLGRCPHVLR